MRKNYRLAILALTALAVGPSHVLAQAGGGTLSNEPAGGAAMIFRKPENPPVHGSSGPSIPPRILFDLPKWMHEDAKARRK